MRNTRPERVNRLAVPLTREQIEAADRFFRKMPIWRNSYEALRLIAKGLPEFDLGSVYPKVLAVNALYGARLLATLRMARHIVKTLEGRRRSHITPQDIDRIARLYHPPKKRFVHHVSFASKFAHFFIAPEQFFMVDQHTKSVLSRHLGVPASSLTTYVEHADAYRRLEELAEIDYSYGTLDHYIWLAGLIWKARRSGKPIGNTELRELVGRRDPEIKRDIATMLGDIG